MKQWEKKHERREKSHRMTKKDWLHEGIETEKEHKRTIGAIRRLRGKRVVYKAARLIARDHLRESPSYYSALEKMEKGLKKKKKKRVSYTKRY